MGKYLIISENLSAADNQQERLEVNLMENDRNRKPDNVTTQAVSKEVVMKSPTEEEVQWATNFTLTDTTVKGVMSGTANRARRILNAHRAQQNRQSI